MSHPLLSPAEQAARRYFAAGSGEAWRWAEGAEVLVWAADGGTVAFREELAAILDALAPRGVPTFAAVALLLAACRGRTLTVAETLGPEEVQYFPDSEASVAEREIRARCAEILFGLAALNQWPRELLADPQAKATLAEMVFEQDRLPSYPPAQARELVDSLRGGTLTEVALNQPTGHRIFYRDVLFELQGVLNVTPARLARRQRTGLDEIVAPAPLPEEVLLPPAELSQGLLDQLQRRPEHAALGRVARDLLAALSLPRRLPETDAAAPGGAADLSNRGPLDKLLLSELAYDDLTLASRVALNEALYLRHEPPAAPRSAGLALLLDAGVRLWGVPRVFATAAALALGLTDARRPTLQAWRADGPEVRPVDLWSMDGLENYLGTLATAPHPGAAFPAFVAALAAGADEKKAGQPIGRVPEVEAVILTHQDTLADPAFRQRLDAYPLPTGLRLSVGTVNREGNFKLTKYPPTERTPLCQATIRLDDLQRPAEGKTGSATPLLDPRYPAGLPVILGLSRLPFLLPVRDFVAAFHRGSDGRIFAAVQPDPLYKRDESTHRSQTLLLAWKDPACGAETLVGGLPSGRILLLAQEPDSPRLCLLTARWHAGKIPLAIYDLETGGRRAVELGVSAPPVAARLEHGVIFLFYPQRFAVFRLGDGVELARTAMSGEWSHGRYYRGGLSGIHHWSYAAWDGLAAREEPVRGDVQTVRQIFDREGQPGPWVLTETGQVRHLESGEAIFSFPRKLVSTERIRLSRDGHHLHVEGQRLETYSVDLGGNPPTLRTFSRKKLNATTAEGQPLARPEHTMMTRFTHVSALPGGRLLLRSSRRQWFEFDLLPGEKLFWRPGAPIPLETGCEQPFQPVPGPENCPYDLQEAAWPEGSRAFLDSRGLLHLKSADFTLPEISLALSSAPSAIWTSDGRMAGARFFLGPDRVPAPVGEMLAVLQRFCTLLQ